MIHPLKKQLKRGQKTEFPSTIRKPKLICAKDTQDRKRERVCVCVCEGEREREREMLGWEKISIIKNNVPKKLLQKISPTNQPKQLKLFYM